MAVSVYSETDLRLIAAMDGPKIERLLAGRSINNAMIMRRNLQISLAAISKKNPATGGKLTPLQGAIIWICGVIERVSMRHFCLMAWRKCKKAKKDMTESEKLMEKLKIKGEWEKYLKRMSF